MNSTAPLGRDVRAPNCVSPIAVATTRTTIMRLPTRRLKSAATGRNIVMTRFGMGKTSRNMLVRTVDRATERFPRAARAERQGAPMRNVGGKVSSGRLLRHPPQADGSVIAARQG